MTALDARPARAEIALRLLRSPRAPAVFGIVVVLLTAVTRLTAVLPAYDLHVDEFVYALASRDVLEYGLPARNADGPILIHPPGFFMIGALTLGAAGGDGDVFADVAVLRTMQQLFAIATAAAVWGLTTRAAGPVAGLIAGIVFALDPFVLRMNGRILLETSAVGLALVGLWLLARLRRRPHSLPLAIGTGAAFGAALLMKDMVFFLTIAPVLVLLVTGRPYPRRTLATVLAASVAPYAAWVASLTTTGLLPRFISVKGDGFARLLGAQVTTGYNVEGPGLAAVIAERVSTFGASLGIVAAGGVAAIVLLVRPRSWLQRLLGLVTVCAAAPIAYGMVRGTSEEQLFYFAMVPAVITTTVVGARVFRRLVAHDATPHPATLSLLLAAALASNLLTWAQTRTSDDTALRDASHYVERVAPEGSIVGYASPQTPLALEGDGYLLVELGDALPPGATGTVWATVLVKDVEEGYASIDARELAELDRRGELVFSEESASYDRVLVYRVAGSALP